MQENTNNIQIGIFNSSFLPVKSFKIGYNMNALATAIPMFPENAIKNIITDAGIASVKSSKSTCLITASINIPITIKTALQADDGIIENTGDKNNPVKNKIPTTTAVSPERPPAITPVVDST